MNSYKVQLCEKCCAVSCKEHNEGSFQEWMCEICSTSYPTQLAGNRCCLDMIDRSTLPASCFAPVKKKTNTKALEYPTLAIARGRKADK